VSSALLLGCRNFQLPPTGKTGMELAGQEVLTRAWSSKDSEPLRARQMLEPLFSASARLGSLDTHTLPDCPLEAQSVVGSH
jgi:hypothetical protein